MVKICYADDIVLQLYPGVFEPGPESLHLSRHLVGYPGERALVLGSGCGLAAISLARLGCSVTAVDISAPAVRATCRNALMNDVSERLTARTADLREVMAGDETWDVVVSNPPQMPTPPEQERSDWIALANNGGSDGREYIDAIARSVSSRLNPGGRVQLLHSDLVDIEATKRLLAEAGLSVAVSAPLVKEMGVLSYERREMFAPGRELPRYHVYVLTGRKLW